MSRTPYYPPDSSQLPPISRPSHPSRAYVHPPQAAYHPVSDDRGFQGSENLYYRPLPAHGQPSTHYSSESLPPTPASSTTSHVFAFRPPLSNSAHAPQVAYRRPSVLAQLTPPFNESVSPTRARVSFAKPDYRPQSSGTSRTRQETVKNDQAEDLEEDDEASSPDGDEVGERQKLEVRREKNRLKQRNLRLRRATHVASLEASLETLESKHRDLEQQIREVKQREAGLEEYVASLEGLLRRHGLESELNHLKAGRETAGGSSRGTSRARDELEGVEEDATGRGSKRRKVVTGPRGEQGRGSGQTVLTTSPDVGVKPASSTDFSLPHRMSDPGPVSSSYFDHLTSRPTSPDTYHPVGPKLTRPRRSTTGFSPLILDSSHSSPFLAAPSPRSMRIEDLLSPSFTQDEVIVPLSAYTIDTPSHLASTPRYNAEIEGPRLTGGMEVKVEEVKEAVADESMVTDNRAVIAGDGQLDIESPGYIKLIDGFSNSTSSTPSNTSTAIAAPPLHPSIYTARILLRILLADQVDVPISHCILPPLNPGQQNILLNAIYNLTIPTFRDQVNLAQSRNLPTAMIKAITDYPRRPEADLRIILLPIAILRARVVGFLEEGLPFDITAFISHVLADGRIFGDTADPDAWEMSETFWDVWGGWFKAGRGYCGSMKGQRRRYGHHGANIIEILLGLEGKHSRMHELIGKPEGWKKVEVTAPSKEMTDDVDFEE